MRRVPEVFAMSHFHFDIGDHFKLLGKVGLYGGYRLDITRIPEESYAQSKTFLEYEHAFREYDRRWSYGVKGGLGWRLQWAQSYMAYDIIYTIAICFIIMAFILITILFIVQRHTMSWSKEVVQW